MNAHLSSSLPRLAIALLCLQVVSPSGNATPDSSTGIFIGTLGSKAIVTKLDADPAKGKVTRGLYFYRSMGRDILLIQGKDNRLQECPSNDHYSDDGCDKPTGYWKIARSADGLAGQWTSVDGKKSLAIALSPIQGKTADSTSDPDTELRRLRLEGGKQSTGALKSSNGITWQVRKDLRSGITMPFVTSGIAEAIKTKVNGNLQQRFENDINEALTAADYSPANELLFANANYLVVGGGVGAYYMGAAHPLYGFTAIVFDLSSGNEIDMKGLFRFSDSKAKNIDLRRNDLLDALALRAYQREAKKESDGESCLTAVVDRYGCEGSRCDNKEHFEYALLYPTEKGLAVTIDIYSEAERGCRGQGVILPWPAVRKTLLQPVTMP